ncbi:MAG: DUF2207 domain-containing protein [Eubacteriales bacterium]
MSKQKKYIKTKEIENLERLDKCVWLIPIYFCIKSFNPKLIFNIFLESFATGIFTLICFVLLLGVLYVPLMMIWRGVTKTLRMNAIMKASFPAMTDLDYYRHELTGITPAMISMCTDLEIEIEKDITAQILKYSMDGIVSTENGTITVLTENFDGFSASDTFLLKTLMKDSINPTTALQWKKIVKDEIMDGPLLQPKQPKKYSKVKGPLLYFSSFAIIWVCITTFMTSDAVWNLLSFEDISNEELLQLIIQDPRYALIMVGITLAGITGLCTFAYPVATLLKAFITMKSVDTIERTKKGQELTEKIYGMKNFIHDFSNLAYADKESLILWDDFLIYAVVLEENSSIIEEILYMRNIQLTKIQL